MTPPRGRRTDARVTIPPDRLDSQRIYSRPARLLGPEETRAADARNRSLLDRYGLSIASIVVLPLNGGAATAGRLGPLQTEHRDRLVMVCSLGALAVSLSGRGDLLAIDAAARSRHKMRIKENNDRNSTAAMTEGLYALCEADPQVSFQVAIGEGTRVKPGERGGNPTLYAGQVIGAGPRRYSLAVDAVEGTTKSALFDPSCGTLLFATEAPIPAVPDVYFDKCQLWDVDDVTVNDPLERIVEAIRDRRGSREIDIFALDRPRHPIEAMLALGANMRLDTDVDAYPAVAAGLRWGVFPDNLRPLDGVCANIGGAAETIASAAGARYLGVRSTARFCAGTIPRWEARYDFGPGEEEAIGKAGFDPARVYAIEDLVPGLTAADGAFVAAAISDNWHVPGLDAVCVGGNFATVCALYVGSASPSELWRVTFAFRRPWEETVAALTPVLTRILALEPPAIASAVKQAVADPQKSRRLRHEIATSFYSHMREGVDSGGRMRLDLAAAAGSETPEALAFLRAVVEAAPDWFVPA
jgi:fructose-1,6-bisphosphatase/sedoheptulose 1,7-bisphosphatase-like protein